ncbi:MAG: GNAT family N-acetyltransferase [Solirubrobacteraceae bacterium]
MERLTTIVETERLRAEPVTEGFATELGAASVRHAFEQLALDVVVAFTLPDNRASRRVMEKLGFEFERDIEHAGLPHVLYRRVERLPRMGLSGGGDVRHERCPSARSPRP